MNVPTSPELWFKYLRVTSDKVAGGELSLGGGIRRINNLRNLAPGAVSMLFLETRDKRAIQKALNSNEFEMALGFLFNPELFSVDIKAEGNAFSALVRTGIFRAAGTAKAENFTEAKFLAWLECISEIKARCLATAFNH